MPADPFYRRPIVVLSHDPNPYWGPPNSAVDWCEANYLHSRYVAEMFNTISSIPLVVVSLWGFWLCNRYGLEMRFYVCWAGMGFVGVGSILFHGTLQHYGQAADELAMIYTSLAFAYVVLESGHVNTRNFKLLLIECAYAVGFSFAYFSSPLFFPYFVAAYAGTVLLIIYQAFRILRVYWDEITEAARWQRCLFLVGATFYPGGFLLLWIPENALCPLMPEVLQWFNLHAVFHIVTAISPYCYLVAMTYHRCVILRRRAEHRQVIGLPYVHVFKIEP